MLVRPFPRSSSLAIFFTKEDGFFVHSYHFQYTKHQLSYKQNMNLYLHEFIKDTFKKPANALDLGAGDFFDVACMKQLGWKCEGVDLNTGTNLEKPFLSKHGPFRLVYSNYVFHKIKNKKTFLQTIYNNLMKDGWFFIHTFDASDPNSSSDISKRDLEKSLREAGFSNIRARTFNFYDNEAGHRHWHKILEAVGQKK